MQNFDFTSSVTFLIIGISTVSSLLALYGVPGLFGKGYLKPYRVVREHSWYELITSGFLHANFGHLFVNMFTLYFFGQIMEYRLGPVYFLALYLTAMIVAGIPSVIKYKDNPDYATLGASGAVSGVLFAYIYLYPLRSIYLLFIPIPIPAFVFGILYLAYSMYESKQERGKINHEAHIAGALWGIVYLLVLPSVLSFFY